MGLGRLQAQLERHIVYETDLELCRWSIAVFGTVKGIRCRFRLVAEGLQQSWLGSLTGWT